MSIDELYIKILPKQLCYKVEDGEASEVPLRLGILTDKLYRNRNVISTIYGEEPFVPKVEVKVFTHTDNKCYIIVTISNYETRTTVKQIVIRSQPNSLSLKEMKKIHSDLIDILEIDSETNIIDLIEFIRNIKNDEDKIIQIEEYC